MNRALVLIPLTLLSFLVAGCGSGETSTPADTMAGGAGTGLRSGPATPKGGLKSSEKAPSADATSNSSANASSNTPGNAP